jgi:hypothetical protein
MYISKALFEMTDLSQDVHIGSSLSYRLWRSGSRTMLENRVLAVVRTSSVYDR